MRVLYLHQYFVPPDGRGGTRSLEMASRLVRGGHEVVLITSSAFFPSHYRFERRGPHLRVRGIELRVVRVPYHNRFSYLRRVAAFLTFSVKASVAVLREPHFDVIFATSTPLTIIIPALVAKWIRRRPLVFEVRDLWPSIPIAIGVLRNRVLIWCARMLERLAYHNASHVVTLSPGMSDQIVASGVDRSKVTVIPNGCDIDLFRADPLEVETFAERYAALRGQLLVTYAGTLGTVNGVEYLAEIAAAMRSLDRGIGFVVAGEGREESTVRKRACDHDVLDRNFWMLGPIPKVEVPNLLAMSAISCSLVIDVEVMWHNSANKFFDALAAGTAVMINHGGWQADLLRESGAGIVIPPGNAQVAACMIRDFLRDTERVTAAKLAAHRLAHTRFNRDELGRRLMMILEYTATGTPRPRRTVPESET